MTQPFASAFRERSPGLPDPQLQPGFYDGLAGKRFFAWIVDLILVGLMTVLLSLLTLGIGFFFFPVIWFLVDFTYRVVGLKANGATRGHRLMGIEFRDRFGKRPDTATAVLLTGGYLLSTAFILPQILSSIMVLLSDRRQSLTDYVLGTAAINRPAG